MLHAALHTYTRQRASLHRRGMQAMLRKALGRQWQLAAGASDPVHVELLNLFADTPPNQPQPAHHAALSLHSLCEAGKGSG